MEISEKYKKAKEEAFVSHMLEMCAMLDPHVRAIRAHTKALACHCECLRMNAENAIAVCENRKPPYSDAHYYAVMKQWNLIDEKGEHLL